MSLKLHVVVLREEIGTVHVVIVTGQSGVHLHSTALRRKEKIGRLGEKQVTRKLFLSDKQCEVLLQPTERMLFSRKGSPFPD